MGYSTAKSTARQLMRDLMIKIDGHAETTRMSVDHCEQVLFGMEIFCIHMQWDDLFNEVKEWRSRKQATAKDRQ